MIETLDRKTIRRNQIIQAAATVFAKTGFIKSTVAEIAEKAGIGKGTVYEYFRSKDALFFAVFEDYWRNAAAKTVLGMEALGCTASQRLQAMNEAIMAQWRDMVDSFPLIIEFWAASASPLTTDRFKNTFQQGYMEFRKIVEVPIRDGVECGEFKKDIDVAALATALVGAWDALFLQAWFDADFDPLYTAQQFFRVLIAGLKA
jgi:AcrR family transcriptional regulator